jgi:hypothetical protein
MMPFKMIINAANTVSRAKPAASSPPAAIKETMRATSIKVTASARTRVPKGSPILCATPSAWWTAAKTLPVSAIAITATMTAPPAPSPAAISTAPAKMGAATVQKGICPLDCMASAILAGMVGKSMG